MNPSPEVFEVGEDLGDAGGWEESMVRRDEYGVGGCSVTRKPGGHHEVEVACARYEIAAVVGDDERMFAIFETRWEHYVDFDRV